MFSSIKQIFESPIKTTVTLDMVVNDKESYKQFYDVFNKNTCEICFGLEYFETINDSYKYNVFLCYLYDKEKQCVDNKKPIYITQQDFCNLIIKICPYSFTITKQKNGICVNKLYIK